jgi:hypothetical protein
VSLSFEFDADGNEDAVLDAARRAIEDRVSAVRCPVHHTGARVRFSGDSHDLKWSVEGCCDQLVNEVKRALA